MLPVRPEPDAALRARYPAAVAPVYDVERVVARDTPRPGDQPAHVFDTIDGVRLIVSRERWPDGDVTLHLSASFHDHCPTELTKIRKVLAIDDALTFMLGRFRDISGERGAARLVGLSESKGVPHWIVRSDRHEDIRAG